MYQLSHLSSIRKAVESTSLVSPCYQIKNTLKIKSVILEANFETLEI